MKTCIIAETYISRNSETIVKVNENLEFSVIPQICPDNNCNYILFIKKIKGDFEIEKISFDEGECEAIKENVIYLQKSLYIALLHTFHLLTEVKFDVVISVMYHLKIDGFKMKYLKEFEAFYGKIILSDYGNKEFRYMVKRNSTDIIEITVENFDKIRINGQNDDYTFQASIDENVDHKLSFIFEQQITNKKSMKADDIDQNTTKSDISKIGEFIGKWELESSGNFVEWITTLGMAWMYPTNNFKPHIIINVIGNHWHMEFVSMVQHTILDFELGKEFKNGENVINIFTFLENGKLRQIQKAIDANLSDTIIDRYIENEKLITEMEYYGVKARRIYSRATTK